MCGEFLRSYVYLNNQDVLLCIHAISLECVSMAICCFNYGICAHKKQVEAGSEPRPEVKKKHSAERRYRFAIIPICMTCLHNAITTSTRGTAAGQGSAYRNRLADE